MGINIKTLSKAAKKHLVIDVIVGVLLFAACVYLFFCQASWTPNSLYPSDLPEQMRNVPLGQNYSLIEFIMGLIMQYIPKIRTSMALLETALIFATWLVSTRFIKKYFGERIAYPELVALPLLFLASIYVPNEAIGFYRGSLITQPWHNITFIGMRLLSVVTMFFFVEALQKPEDETLSLGEWLRIAVSLALATLTKPNFLLSFGLTLAVFVVVKFCLSLRRGNDVVVAVKRSFAMGSVVFPALIILWIQSRVLYGTPDPSGEESGIIIQLLDSSFFADGIDVAAIKLVNALLLPTLLLFALRKCATDVEGFVFGHYLAAIAIVIAIAETGPRAMHGNFDWGLYNAAYLLYLWFVPWFVTSCKQQLARSGRISALNVVCALLLVCQLLCGARYFSLLLMGETYLI